MEEPMKKLVLALAAVLGIAFVAPMPAAQAQTVKKVIIKRDHDRGHHYGWRHRHGGNKVVIVKKRGHHHNHHNM
jgi:Ni/Co efflux regulator RcnB